MSVDATVAEVTQLKAVLDGSSAANEEAQLEALTKLRALGSLPTKVLSSTLIGKTINTLSQSSALEAVKASAKELVEEWRQMHRKRKAAASGGEGASAPKLVRTESCVSTASMFSEAPAPAGPTLERRDSNASLPRMDSTLSVTELPNSQASVVEDPAAPKPLTPQRQKVLQKIREALGKEEEVTIENKNDDNTEDKMRDPGVLATEIEEALHAQLGDGKDNRDYMGQARAVLFNLKDAKNPTFRFKLMIGFILPEQVPKLSSEDMASDDKNAERMKMRKYAMEEIQSDWAVKHGQGGITGMFTCGKCKGVKTTYFQMQTRSSDEPMTTFVTCLTCNNRWKFC